MKKTVNEIAGTLLGKKVSGSETYDPFLLVPVPRKENRDKYDIDTNNLPFEGGDVWRGYEFSSITNKGLPFTRVINIFYNCASDFIVESKSLKLYLNSFNMTRMRDTVEESLSACMEIISLDLSRALKTPVRVSFMKSYGEGRLFDNYRDLEEYYTEDLSVNVFEEFPQALLLDLNSLEEERKFRFDSLRSNCRVTHQPDFGTVFIKYRCGDKKISPFSLVQYLSSFRKEYHFHEECVEMIFKRLYDFLKVGKEGGDLMVCALYTRRGGIDINPFRYTPGFEDDEDLKKLKDPTLLYRGNLIQ